MKKTDYSELIKKMTLEEKASLTSGKNFWETMNINKYDIPSIYLADGPHGIRKQVASPDKIGLNVSLPSTCFPTFSALANSWDRDLLYRVGKAIGEEAVKEKVSVVLGPGINIKRDPLCGRNFEYFSEDPYLSGKLASHYIQGIQEEGIYACVKHFVCENQETRRMVVNDIVDERALREIYLTDFEIAIKEGKAKAIMTSYSKVNGTYANENYHLMTGVLRNDFKYNGLVISNWGGSNDRVKGLVAGNDLEMPTTLGETNKQIVEAVKSNYIGESDLDNACRRILDTIFETTEVFQQNKDKEIDYIAHDLLAQEAGEKSIVLLKNKNEILPLDSTEKIAVIGSFADKPKIQGSGSSSVNPTHCPSFNQLAKDYPLNIIGYSQGYKRFGGNSKSLVSKALHLANQADVILYFMGLDELSEVDGLDRNNMRLDENQISLLYKLTSLGKKVVVVLTTGSAVELNFADNVDGLIHTFLLGQEGQKAILNVLTGKANPSGKLAESYPYVYLDSPSSSNFASDKRNIQYRESIFVGYRYYSTNNVKVRYPFGFGLSYTKYEYSDLVVSSKGVAFKVKNVGKMEGEEICQLYISKKESAIFRAKEELKGFEKVHLLPQEEKEVKIPFTNKTFRFFDILTNNFEVEKGEYTILIGASSEDIRLNATLDLPGIEATGIYDKSKLACYFSGDIKNATKDEFERLIREKIPSEKDYFYKKNRCQVNMETTLNQLKFAPCFIGRMVSGFVNFLIWFYKKSGKKAKANEYTMGVLNSPLRSLTRMSNGLVSWGEMEGLILIFNCHIFKGIHQYFKAKKYKKREIKVYKELSK